MRGGQHGTKYWPTLITREHRSVVCRSCTSTTLSLFDWLKLEDISISLFFVTVSRRNKKRHRLGQRQPRYMKFFQVCSGNHCA